MPAAFLCLQYCVVFITDDRAPQKDFLSAAHGLCRLICRAGLFYRARLPLLLRDLYDIRLPRFENIDLTDGTKKGLYTAVTG